MKDLMNDKLAREEVIGRVEVLEKVKQLILLPNTEYATTRMVAEYYEVSQDVLRTQLTDNKDELESDGVVFKKYSEIKDDVNREDFSQLKVSRSGTNIYTRRAILRVGMLLRDSEVAKEVRTYLLNVEHDTQKETPQVIDNIVEEIDEEQRLQTNVGMAFIDGDPTKILLATQELHRYVVSLKDKRIQQIESEKEIIITNALTIKESRKIINAISRAIASNTGRKFGEVYGELYKKLNYKLNINIKSRCTGKKKPLDVMTDGEMFECEKICRSWAMDLGLDVEKIVRLK